MMSRKKFIALLLACILVLGLAGCAQSGGRSEPGSSSAEESGSPVEESNSPAEEPNSPAEEPADRTEIPITVLAGNREEFSFSDAAILAKGEKFTIFCGEGLGDTKVLLAPVSENLVTAYEPTPLTPESPAVFDAVIGEWFRIGVSVKSDPSKNYTVSVEAEGVEVKIP